MCGDDLVVYAGRLEGYTGQTQEELNEAETDGWEPGEVVKQEHPHP